MAESASFVDDEGEADQAGHGTAVAGAALYGDVEACNESNFWQPQFWIYNGKVMNEVPSIPVMRFTTSTPLMLH